VALKETGVNWLRRGLQATAVAYPLLLVAIAATLRWVGEAWWVSTVALYLPRIGFALPLPLLAVALHLCRMRLLFWAQAVSIVVLLFPLMGFVLPWPAPTAKGGETLRVLSFNVDGGAGRADAIMDEVDRYSPDIVLFQEVGKVDDLSRLLRMRYPSVELTGQFAVGARFPLSSTSEPILLPYMGRSRSARFLRHVLSTPFGRIVIYNVHPISPREGLYGLRGQQGLRHEALTGGLLRGDGAPLLGTNAGLRTLQVQTISESASAETGPVIIAGDTNLPGLSPVLHRYLSTYADGFTRAGWGFGYTFPADKWRPWMRIDRILANDSFRFVRFEVGHSKASDHRCVVADLGRSGL
jgi:endonuclease/exonuclease/phosphatase (EEP) superfamily protein YafD